MSSFGISGTNCHVVLEEAPPRPVVAAEPRPTPAASRIFTLSAKKESVLEQLVRDFCAFLDTPARPEDGLTLDNLCYTACAGREHYRYRLALIVRDLHELREKLGKIADTGLKAAGEGVCYSAHRLVPSSGKKQEKTDRTAQEKARLSGQLGAKLADCARPGKTNRQILPAVASLYVRGADADWEVLYRENAVRRISLPTYPFQKIRCWLDIPAAAPGEKREGEPAKLRSYFSLSPVSRLEKKKKHGQQSLPTTAVHINPQVIKNQHPEDDHSEIEKMIIRAWRQVLGYSEFEFNDNFFEIGGDSLLLMQIQSVLQDNLNIKIPINVLFDNPTISRMADYLINQRGSSGLAIQPATVKEYYTTSHAQKRLWLLDRIETDHSLYNMGIVYDIFGNLNVNMLKKAASILIERHEIFRANFKTVKNGGLVQFINNFNQVSIRDLDLSRKNSNQRKSIRENLISETLNTSFDLVNDRLFRIAIIKSDKETFSLVIVAPNIITDFWSFRIISNELGMIYNACANNLADPLAEVKYRYVDYCEYEDKRNREELLDQERYWIKKLSGSLPELNLPYDEPRKKLPGNYGKIEKIIIAKSLTDRLKHLAYENEVSVFVMLLAIFKVFIYKITEQRDIIIGTFAANRDNKEWENVVGLLVNNLAIRTNLTESDRFLALLKRVKQNVVEGIANKEYPFESIIEKLSPPRNLSQTPIFNTLFQVFNEKFLANSVRFGDITAKSRIIDNIEGQFDLNLRVLDIEKNEFHFILGYNDSLFDRDTIKHFLDFLNELCHEVADNPDKRISELNILSAKKKKRLLQEFLNIGTKNLRQKTIHELIDLQAKKTPNNIALQAVDEELTYTQMVQKVNVLAGSLASEFNIGPKDYVALIFEKSTEAIISMLAVLKCGAAYIPINDQIPKARIELILKNHPIKLALVSRRLANRLGSSKRNIVPIDSIKVEQPRAKKKYFPSGKSFRSRLCIFYLRQYRSAERRSADASRSNQ